MCCSPINSKTVHYDFKSFEVIVSDQFVLRTPLRENESGQHVLSSEPLPEVVILGFKWFLWGGHLGLLVRFQNHILEAWRET